MLLCVSAAISSTSYLPAYETDPEIFRAVADRAQRGISCAEREFVGGIVRRLCCECQRGVGISTYGTASSLPFLQAGAVEEVLAEDREEAGCVVHALEADGAGGEFDEGMCWWWEGFEISCCRGRWRERVVGEFGEGTGWCLKGDAFDEEGVAGFWLLGVNFDMDVGEENKPPFQ